MSLADGLSFDAWIPHATEDSTANEVGTTYLNWLHTNLQGMAFGHTVDEMASAFMYIHPALPELTENALLEAVATLGP